MGVGREPAGGQHPLEHLEAATPGGTGHRAGRPRPGPGLGGLALTELGEGSGVEPVVPHVLGLPRFGDLQLCPGQQRRPQRVEVDRVDVRARADVDLGGTAVEAGDAQRPQPLVEVRVVAVPEEGLGVGQRCGAVEVRYDRDLVIAAHGRQDRADAWIGECGIEIAGTFLGRGAELPRGRVLHGDQAGESGEPGHGLLVNRRGETGGRQGRGQDRDVITGTSLGRKQLHRTMTAAA